MTLDIDPETLKHQDSTPEKALLLNVLSKWKQAEKYKCIWLLYMNEEYSFSKILRNHLSPFWHTSIISVSFENFSSTSVPASFIYIQSQSLC